MAALIDGEALGTTQRVELYEEGIVWIIDTDKAENRKEIKLDAAAATRLFDFLQLHQDRLSRQAHAQEENPVDWKAIDEQAKVDLAAIVTDQDVYDFMHKYLSKELMHQYMLIYRSDRHEMNRSPKQALENLLSLPPL